MLSSELNRLSRFRISFLYDKSKPIIECIILSIKKPSGNHINFIFLKSINIKFLTKDGKELVVYIDSHFVANNGDFLKLLAESNHGITYLPRFIVWQSLASQALVPVLTDYQMQTMHAYAVYPPNRHLPLKVRSLIDFLVERFGENPYWEQT